MRQALHEEIAYTVLQQNNFYRYSETKTLAGVRMNEIQHIPQLATPQPATTNTTPKLQLTPHVHYCIPYYN